MSDTPIRVLIADDHALVREGIRRVLDEDPGFDVVAEAADGRQASRWCRHCMTLSCEADGARTGAVVSPCTWQWCRR